MVIREELSEYERLEKPAGVGHVPLGRAGFRHGLDDIILGFQCFADFVGKPSYVTIPEQQFGLRSGVPFALASPCPRYFNCCIHN